MASVAQRSISTKVTRRLRSFPGVVDAELLQAEHGEAHAENLSGAEMSVGLFSVAEVFVDGVHRAALSLSAFGGSLKWHPAASIFFCQRMPSLK